MSIDYTINFKEDYKETILEEFAKNNVDVSSLQTDDISKLSLEFHKYQKTLQADKLSQEVSQDAQYSSDMMFKWLTYLEDGIKDSIDEIVELARQNNINITKFPLHIQLQLDVETQSYTLFETENGFNIDLSQEQ